jgi:hypothetical protein
VIRSAQDLPPDVQEIVRRGKAAYGQVYLITGTSGGREVFALLRALSKREADLLELEHDNMRQQEDMLSRVLIHPAKEDMEDWDAGTVDLVLNAAVRVSGWDAQGLVEGMQAANEHRASMYGAMVAFICAAFKLTPEEVDEMDRSTLLRHLALAQDVHGRAFDFQPWLDPEGWAKKNRHRMRRIPGGRAAEVEVPQGAVADPVALAQEQGERSMHDILNDPGAVKVDPSDRDSIRKLIQEQRRGMNG